MYNTYKLAIIHLIAAVIMFFGAIASVLATSTAALASTDEDYIMSTIREMGNACKYSQSDVGKVLRVAMNESSKDLTVNDGDVEFSPFIHGYAALEQTVNGNLVDASRASLMVYLSAIAYYKTTKVINKRHAAFIDALVGAVADMEFNCRFSE